MSVWLGNREHPSVDSLVSVSPVNLGCPVFALLLGASELVKQMCISSCDRDSSHNMCWLGFKLGDLLDAVAIGGASARAERDRRSVVFDNRHSLVFACSLPSSDDMIVPGLIPSWLVVPLFPVVAFHKSPIQISPAAVVPRHMRDPFDCHICPFTVSDLTQLVKSHILSVLRDERNKAARWVVTESSIELFSGDEVADDAVKLIKIQF